MESPREKKSFTPSQQQAIAARGNVLVMAGAGTGKTHTLVARCLDCLARDGASLQEILIVTFTEAAAAEMRQRIRAALEKSSDPQLAAQLALFDTAHIGTLHGFCFKLIRENFYRLGLEPQPAILDQGAAAQLAAETLDEQFHAHYEGEDEFSKSFQDLIQVHGHGRDEKIGELVLRLHHYSQTRPDAGAWLAEQVEKFSEVQSNGWQNLLTAAIQSFHDEWLPVLENIKSENPKAAELAGILSRLKTAGRQSAGEILAQVAAADLTASYPRGQAGKLRPALGKIFEEAGFLRDLATMTDGHDPLAEDWLWVRDHMKTLARLAQEFAGKFSGRKRDDGVLDFHDLEQFALALLQEPVIAQGWRQKLRFIFVDEYQDINAAQDKIIQCLSGENESANRFLVGDVKQSIYRFRLADPKIFQGYAQSWRDPNGRMIPLSENFRSRESLLHFVNSVFTLVMREEIGGVHYDADARLNFGSADTRAAFSIATDPAPRTELFLRIKNRAVEKDEENFEIADLKESEKEARLVAQQLQKLVTGRHEIWDDTGKNFRPVEWRDMAVLLRAPGGKAEIFAKEFSLAGIPLVVERGGFFDSSEILDLLSLLQLLDNPLQDVPCIAVLRSPFGGFSLDELAEIRLVTQDKHFWTALVRSQQAGAGCPGPAAEKACKFLAQFSRWRKVAKQSSLSQCLEMILAETHYDGWLKSLPRGAQRHANVARFLTLAQRFDEFQRQGLFRFLKFVEAQRDAEIEPEVAAVAEENAVRLMSIHQSKGLEFPVVAVADLGKNFNETDLNTEILFDEDLGLCPQVKPPHAGGRYSSLPHWLAQKKMRRELRGEELRLLYVALTRARDTLILTASIAKGSWERLASETGNVTTQKIAGAKSCAAWLGLWLANQHGAQIKNLASGTLPHLRWRIFEDTELGGKLEAGNLQPEKNLPELDDATTEKLRGMLSWNYKFEAATHRAAKSSVTALRRAAEEMDDEAGPVFFNRNASKDAVKTTRNKLSASEIGAAHHEFLEHVALEQTGELAAEADRLLQEGFLSAEERAVLDLPALAHFWGSELGKKIAAQSASVKRELVFTARFSPLELQKITGGESAAGLEEEFVVVQGVADLVVLLPAEIWLVDFKTDAFAEMDLPEKLRLYQPQLELYAAALEKIYHRPVRLRALHFLALRRTEMV